ncbi:hypothetical protein NDN08_006589 [Rhodosorus marinus]|uniref:FAM50A/XAP5 C-terminal domain-containing protein n=1 Tax=Rhodosorus marinus TaxID=101924 RepID=A0AAV8UI66_9RHOD|nr:hypothetical protein NDN08_006589 [Rhodosorus marinus]
MASYTGTGRDTARIQHLEEERKRKREELERQKSAISEATATSKYRLGENFVSHKESVEDLLKKDTVGLVSFQDFKAKRQYLEQRAAEELEKREAARREEETLARKNRLRKANKAKLSFADEEDSEDSDESSDIDAKSNIAKESKSADENSEAKETKEIEIDQSSKRRLGKNPSANTTFLPDRDREIAEKAERERLRQEWENEQRVMKERMIKITYSYWDGSGHRRTLSCKMGTTIGKFLAMVQLEFHDLRNVSADMLMYIKEDLIIPHHYSFYDFIATKARGKSGPLFNFDVHDDVRIINDASKEKEDAHAGKVVERRWYERNKHIFPASRWEVYDKNKNYGEYTIHGGEVN